MCATVRHVSVFAVIAVVILLIEETRMARSFISTFEEREGSTFSPLQSLQFLYTGQHTLLRGWRLYLLYSLGGTFRTGKRTLAYVISSLLHLASFHSSLLHTLIIIVPFHSHITVLIIIPHMLHHLLTLLHT